VLPRGPNELPVAVPYHASRLATGCQVQHRSQGLRLPHDALLELVSSCIHAVFRNAFLTSSAGAVCPAACSHATVTRSSARVRKRTKDFRSPGCLSPQKRYHTYPSTPCAVYTCSSRSSPVSVLRTLVEKAVSASRSRRQARWLGSARLRPRLHRHRLRRRRRFGALDVTGIVSVIFRNATLEASK
jgi:hypothetical protein